MNGTQGVLAGHLGCCTGPYKASPSPWRSHSPVSDPQALQGSPTFSILISRLRAQGICLFLHFLSGLYFGIQSTRCLPQGLSFWNVRAQFGGSFSLMVYKTWCSGRPLPIWQTARRCRAETPTMKVEMPRISATTRVNPQGSLLMQTTGHDLVNRVPVILYNADISSMEIERGAVVCKTSWAGVEAMHLGVAAGW